VSAGFKAWVGSAEPWGGGFKAAVGALSDEALLEKLARYKRQVAKRYRVVEPDVIEQLLPSEELLLSPKLDGELWFLVKKDGDVALCAYNGRVLHGVAPLAGVKEHVADKSDFIVAGELVANVTAERARSYHTGATLSEPKGELALSFHAFDLVEEGGQDRLGTPYEQRHAWLESTFGGLPKDGKVRVVLTERGDPKLVASRYREWVLGNKFEGVVVRSQRGLTYKIKPTTTVDVVIVAFGERVTGEVRQVRELQVGLFRDDGTIQLVGSIGTGLSEDDRARWHQRLSAIEVKSAFRLANREGTLCRFVRPEIVIEMRVSDLLVTDAWDAPIRRMSLRYVGEGEGGAHYEAVSELRTAVPLHPVILRERTDKKPSSTDAGMSQITSYLEEVGVDPVKAGARAAAEVAMRGVFTKETKGQVAVRKYLVVKTNKESEGTHPPFAVFFSDFAAGRKEPLQSSLRTAATMDEARVQVERWLAENIKKGWGEIASGHVGPTISGASGEVPKEAPSSDAEATDEPAKKPAKKADVDDVAEATGEATAEPPKKKKSAKKS
jgi:hypothetical protein